MKTFIGYEKGVGMGGWLTNYKRIRVLTREQIEIISPGDWEHFDTYYTFEDFQQVADWGMDHVRLTFDQVIMENCQQPFTYREKGLSYLDRAISWCHDLSLNVVLNLHHAVGAYCDGDISSLFTDTEEQERFLCLWEMLEKRYHNENCVFELLNEPTTGDTDAWNDLASRAVQRLRAINPNRKIMVGSACWSHPEYLTQLKTYDDPNVVYNFHFYYPMEFSHQRSIMNPVMMVWNRAMPYPGDMERYREFRRFSAQSEEDLQGLDRMDGRYIARRMQPVLDFMESHPNDIVCCNEFSCMSHIPLEQRENWYADIIAFLRKHNIGYTAWNYMHTPYDSTKASLVDEKTRKILSPRFLRILQGTEESATVSL